MTIWSVARHLRLGVLAVAALCGLPAQADTLLRLVESSLVNDPLMKSAGAQREATQEQYSQGIAQLLPQISFQKSRSQNTTEKTITGTIPPQPAQEFEYPSHTKSLQLRQPLLRPRLVFNAFQGAVKAEMGDLQYESSHQQTISRTVMTYLEWLAQSGNVLATRAEKEAAQLRLTRTDWLHKAGQVSDVDLAAARSGALLAAAQLREAQANQDNAQRDLAAMTGQPAKPALAVDWLKAGQRLQESMSNVMQRETEVPDLEAHPFVANKAKTLESVRYEVRKVASDHAPTIDIVAGISEGTSAQDIAINQYTKTKAVGFQLTIPIFSGGMTQSQVREQSALAEKAMYDLDAARLQVDKDRARALEAMEFKREMLTAALADVAAMQLLLRQADMGRAAGIRSAVDVAEAKAKWQRALAKVAESATGVFMAHVDYQLALGKLTADASRIWDAAMAGAAQ